MALLMASGAHALEPARAPLTSQTAQPVVALRALLLVSQDPSSPATPTTVSAAPSAAPREICRPSAPELQTPSTPVNVQQLRADLARATPDMPAGQRVVSALPEWLVSMDAVRPTLAVRIGSPISGELTQAIVADLVTQLNKDGRFLVDVYLPEQTSRDGVLVVVVRPALLGKVTAQGQKFYNGADIACRVRAPAGKPVDLQLLAGDLAQLNTNSGWRHTDAPQFTPGEVPGTTDLTLTTHDEKPLRFFFGADNTGGRATGQGRYRAGVNIGNFLGRFDHQFDYTLTTSDKYSAFNEHSFAYMVPLEDRQRLTARLDLSHSDVLLHDGAFRSQGSNQIASLEWTRPQLVVPSWLNWGQTMASEASYGVEYKRIGNSLQFNQTVLSDQRPVVLQGYGAWRGAWQNTWGSNQVYTRLTVSPGDLVGGNDKETFNAVRAGANPAYWRLNASYNGQVELPAQWSMGLRVDGQVARKPLLPSERMTLSGWGGVRGYYSDTLSADAGVTASLEVLSPRQRLDIAGQTGNWYVVGFLDAGRSWNATSEFNADLNTTAKQFNLVSHGVGVRYETSNHSHFRLDVARRHFGMESERKWLWHGSWQVAF